MGPALSAASGSADRLPGVNYRAVVFDLFGTLVPPFPKAEHTIAVEEGAAILGLDFAFCHQLWIDSYHRRIAGEFADMAKYFAWFGDQAGVSVASDACAKAATAYEEFTRSSLRPLPGVVDTLSTIVASGRTLGLVTNCTPDAASIFPETEMGRYFASTVFSSTARVVKPSPASYELVMEGLGVGGDDVLYVGDGSDGELGGAAAAGMTAVLVTPSLHNTYDQHRPEVENWRGTRIGTIPDVLGLLKI